MPTCPLTIAEQHALICQWTGLPVRVARRLAYRRDVASLGLSEAASAGMVGLIRAAAYYDPTRGTPFAPYAYPIVRQAVLAEAQAWSRRSADVSLDSELGSSGLALAGEVLAPAAPDGADVLDVAAALATLPDRERAVIAHRYGLDGRGGALLRDVGAELNVSHQYISQIESRALRLLRLALV